MKKILLITLLIIGCQKNMEDINEEITSNSSLKFWEVKYFVNQNKEPTDVGYITNAKPIIGTYSNLNASNQKLKVKIMIKRKAIGIKLYENGGEIPIKGNMQNPIEYKINIKHNEKNIDFDFKGINENDVVIIGNIISSDQQTTLINHLKLGGKFEFYMENNEKNKSIYQFQINDLSNIAFSNLYDYLNK